MIKESWGFPFELIKTRVEVLPEHITIYYTQILGTTQTQSIPMEDIHAVEADTDWFIGQLVILHGTPEKLIKIGKFHKEDAKTLATEIQKMLDQKEKKTPAIT